MFNSIKKILSRHWRGAIEFRVWDTSRNHYMEANFYHSISLQDMEDLTTAKERHISLLKKKLFKLLRPYKDYVHKISINSHLSVNDYQWGDVNNLTIGVSITFVENPMKGKGWDQLSKTSSIRSGLIKVAYVHPEYRDDILPVVMAYDKQAAMERQAFVKALIQRISRALPRAAKAKFGQIAKKLKNATWETVYQGLISQIESMGKKLGFQGLGKSIDRGIRGFTLKKVWDLVSTYIKGGFQAVLDFFGMEPPPGAVRVARSKEAVDPLMAIGGGIAILIVAAATLYAIAHTSDDWFGFMLAQDILEAGVGIIAAIFQAIAES